MSTGGGSGGGGVTTPKTPKMPQPASRIPLGIGSGGAPGKAPAPPSGGGGFGGGGGGGTGSNATGQVSSHAPLPSVAQFLGSDSTYQAQLSQYMKALSDAQAQQNTQKTAYNTQFNLDNTSLSDSRKAAESNIADDYSSRGLLNSGVYGKAYADQESQYDTRQTQLTSARDSFIKQLNDALTNLKGDQQTGMTQAKQDAIARRAAGLGV